MKPIVDGSDQPNGIIPDHVPVPLATLDRACPRCGGPASSDAHIARCGAVTA